MQLRELRIQSMLRAVTTFSIVGIPLCVTMATFGLYTALGNDLTPEVAFPALLLFNALMFPLTFLPVVVTNVISVGVALGRIANFLQVPPDADFSMERESVLVCCCLMRVKDENTVLERIVQYKQLPSYRVCLPLAMERRICFRHDIRLSFAPARAMRPFSPDSCSFGRF